MRLSKLQSKDVVNITNGKKIGYVSDVDIEWSSYSLRALYVVRMSVIHYFYFFKDPPCLTVPVECIVSLSGDVILVNMH